MPWSPARGEQAHVKQILFVDDEPQVLEAIRTLLRRQRRIWEMHFAVGAPEALAVLETRPIDVVISDVRMPGMDGIALLERVKATQPGATRILLTGHADREAVLRALPLAHRFLRKPCDSSVLQNVIERSCSVQDLLQQPELRLRINGLDRLPCSPEVYFQLVDVLTRADAEPGEVATVMARDPALAAKLLQLVNSAFFSGPGQLKRISSVEEAVRYLGVELVKNLTLSAHVFATAERVADASPDAGLSALQRHSFATARLAKAMLSETDREAGEVAFVAGLLHDVGELVLADGSPELWRTIVTRSREEGLPTHAVERDLLGVTHAELGAYLLGSWGLPHEVIEACLSHHAPGSVPSQRFDVVAAVHLADSLLKACESPAGAAAEPDVDASYLARLGVLEKIPGWMPLAQAEVGRWS
jgi:putative nucleotidyltransferase with HDIG domain